MVLSRHSLARVLGFSHSTSGRAGPAAIFERRIPFGGASSFTLHTAARVTSFHVKQLRGFLLTIRQNYSLVLLAITTDQRTSSRVQRKSTVGQDVYSDRREGLVESVHFLRILNSTTHSRLLTGLRRWAPNVLARSFSRQ